MHNNFLCDLSSVWNTSRTWPEDVRMKEVHIYMDLGEGIMALVENQNEIVKRLERIEKVLLLGEHNKVKEL